MYDTHSGTSSIASRKITPTASAMSETVELPTFKDSPVNLEKVLLPEVDPETDSSKDNVDKCPDGGLKAWLVVLGVGISVILGECC